MDFEKLRGEIVSRVLHAEHAADEAQLFENILTKGRKFHQAVAPVVPDDDLLIIFTLPIETTSIFITVTDGDGALVRRVMANLEDMERDGATLRNGSVVSFNDKDLEQDGVAAVLLMPLSTSGPLGGIDETFDHGQDTYSFRLVVFLSFAEYGIWQAHGHEKLMSHLDDIDKNLLTFQQVHQSH